jgi:hypothetical protein
MISYYAVIEYATDIQDLYAAKANGYYAYEDTEDTMIIEKDYESEEKLRADLDDMYGRIVQVGVCL